MRQIEKIRQRCLEEIDNHYADQMTKLVDELRLEDAEAIMHEMTPFGDDDEDFVGSEGKRGRGVAR